MNLSTAYDPAVYEFFFTVESSEVIGKPERGPNSLVMAHQRFETEKALELDELKSEALSWQDLTPPPPRHDNWQFSRTENQAIEYTLLLPDRSFLCITIQGR